MIVTVREVTSMVAPWAEITRVSFRGLSLGLAVIVNGAAGVIGVVVRVLVNIGFRSLLHVRLRGWRGGIHVLGWIHHGGCARRGSTGLSLLS